MKILIAPDSFKGNLTAMEVATNIEQGIKKGLPQAKTVKLPMADGGEGTVRSLVDASGGKIISHKVTGPLGNKVEAFFGLLQEKKTAVIEMATASGLPLVPEAKMDPSRTTTYGTGELIAAALEYDIEKLIIGIGGSATNDAGVGMAQALGVKFLDSRGKEIGFGGGELKNIETIETSKLDPRLKNIQIEVACDVDNPLYGPEGAAHVYAPQKGAGEEMVKALDKNLRYFAERVRNQLGIDLQSIPGSGAAGGLGAGLVAFLGAELRSGIDIVLEVNKIEEILSGVDVVITGEGKMDGQTVQGKTPIGVARKAKEFDLPVIAIAGEIGDQVEKVTEHEIDCIFTAVHRAVLLEEAMEFAPEWLQFSGEQIARLLGVKM
ncbi:MAG: glycerate kinase [Halanaerobiaceae bacterium]